MSNFLQEMRKEIDVVDRQIMAALVRRFTITHKVGVYKKKHRLPPLDKKRESEIFAHKKIMAIKHKLDPLLVEKIFKNIIAEVRKNHRHERNSGK